MEKILVLQTQNTGIKGRGSWVSDVPEINEILAEGWYVKEVVPLPPSKPGAATSTAQKNSTVIILRRQGT